MLPFDRLIRAVDAWAGQHPEEELVAQIGTKGSYEPSHMRWMRLVTPEEFGALVDQSRLLIAHAGTGSFILAAEKQRPVVMLPRLARFKEHTSDHQVHTARWLRDKPGVHVAMTEEDLPGAIAAGLAQSSQGVSPMSSHAPETFIARIRETLLN